MPQRNAAAVVVIDVFEAVKVYDADTYWRIAVGHVDEHPAEVTQVSHGAFLSTNEYDALP